MKLYIHWLDSKGTEHRRFVKEGTGEEVANYIAGSGASGEWYSVELEQLGVLSNTMPNWTEELCKRLGEV